MTTREKPKFSMWDFKPGTKVRLNNDAHCWFSLQNLSIREEQRGVTLLTVQSVDKQNKKSFCVLGTLGSATEVIKVGSEEIDSIVSKGQGNVILARSNYTAEFFPPETIVEVSAFVRRLHQDRKYFVVQAVRGDILLCDAVDGDNNDVLEKFEGKDYVVFHKDHVDRVVKLGVGPVRYVASYDYQIEVPMSWRKQSVPSSYGLYSSPTILVLRTLQKLGLLNGRSLAYDLAERAVACGVIKLTGDWGFATANKKRLHKFLRQNANRFLMTAKALAREREEEDKKDWEAYCNSDYEY